MLNEKKLTSRIKPKIKNVDNMIYMEKRQIQSENEKSNYIVPKSFPASEKSSDNQIYRYFSHSAKYDDNLINYGRVKRPMNFSSNLFNNEDLSDNYQDVSDNYQDDSDNNSAQILNNQKVFVSACSHTNNHLIHSHTNGNSIERLCLLCLLKQNGNVQHKTCPSCINTENCIDCHKPLCYNCKQKLNNGRNMSTSKIVEITEDEENQFPEFMIKTITPNKKGLQVVRQDSNDSMHSKPYSLNIQPNSIFNPHTNLSADEIEALRKYNEEKISSYIKNYGDLKFTKDKRVEIKEKQRILPIPAPRRSNIINTKLDLDAKSENYKKSLEINKSNNNNNNYTTFTQLGFAKKHLMLEKFTDF